MSDFSIDPADPGMSVGQRIRFYRERQGMSRDVLGGLVGKSGRWVKAVERGEVGQPKLPVLLDLAQALKLRDPGRLVGGQFQAGSMFRGPGHPALPSVRDAMLPSRPVPEPRPRRASRPVVPSVAGPRHPSRGGRLRRLLGLPVA